MILDANFRLGRLAAERGCGFASAAAVADAMDRFGIDRALVYHALARESDTRRGNALLGEVIAGHPRLLPCWVAIPNRTPPETLRRALRCGAARAVRLFPRSDHFSIRPWCIERTAAVLSDAGALLLVDFEAASWADDAVDWEGLGTLCGAFPDLPVAVCGVTPTAPTNAAGLLERHPNLHLEIGRLASPDSLRRLVAGGHEGQLLFGSEMPLRHAGAPLAHLALSALPAAARRAILGGNLARLLRCDAGDSPGAALAASPTGVVAALFTLEPSQTVTASAPPAGVIDTHVHLGGWNRFDAADGQPADLLPAMDRCGISRAVLTALWACYGEVALGNRAVAQACAAHPDRLSGYLTLDPKHPREVADELARHGADPGFVGIKAHCGTHAVPITDPGYAPILAYADRREWPVLVHAGIDPDTWRRVCAAYPRATLIVAHVGGMAAHADLTARFADLCRETANLCFDLAASNVYYGFLETLVERAGADKILYGSDYPLLDFGFELGQILYGALDDAARALILGGNARRIFRFPAG